MYDVGCDDWSGTRRRLVLGGLALDYRSGHCHRTTFGISPSSILRRTNRRCNGSSLKKYDLLPASITTGDVHCRSQGHETEIRTACHRTARRRANSYLSIFSYKKPFTPQIFFCRLSIWRRLRTGQSNLLGGISRVLLITYLHDVRLGLTRHRRPPPFDEHRRPFEKMKCFESTCPLEML